ncbi:MAG: hypothetical protein FWE31_05985, partial [Firmicutes bacterium]|nr:hypothetical protein [Bacillota bacterium]
TEQNSWRQSVKNIGRDTYTIALLAYYQDQLEAYIAMDNATGIAGHTALMNRIFAGVKHTTGANQGQFNTEEMASMRNTARDVLMTLPRDVMFEGPDQLLNDIYRFAGTAANNSSRRAVFGFEWSVSAVFAKYMNEAESVGFYVPQMGTNLWINSLVIPRRAQNLDAAYAFINFIKSREIAATNAFTHCGATPIMGAAADIMEMLVDTITFPTTAPVTHYSTRTWLEAQRDIYLEGTSTMTAAAINAEIDGFISWQAMLIASFPRSFGTLEGGASGNFNLGGIFRYFSDGLDVEVDMMLNGVRTATRPAR